MYVLIMWILVVWDTERGALALYEKYGTLSMYEVQQIYTEKCTPEFSNQYLVAVGAQIQLKIIPWKLTYFTHASLTQITQIKSVQGDNVVPNKECPKLVSRN